MRTGPLAFRSPTTKRLFYATEIAPAVRLDPSNPKWVQVCAAGSYVYRGEPVDVTVEKFDQMVRNFRAHPAYDPTAPQLLGRPADEVRVLVLGGRFGVVALNFDHPPPGGPRPGQGWLLDLERRGDQLWALTFFGERAHQGMLSGEWKWTSIEWNGNTQLPTGEMVGAYLSGLALTNDPFIRGMLPIQCSRPGEAMAFAWSVAGDVLCELRCIFSLPEMADVGAVIGEIAKLRVWAMGEASAPVGVDVPDLVARIRRLLNLPTLADAASIFVELDKLLGRLAAETPEENPMPDPTQLARRLAARFKTDPNDETAITLATEMAFQRGDEAMGHVTALSDMLGAKDPKDLAGKLGALMELAAKSKENADALAALVPEIEAAQQAEEAAEGEAITADVNAVMAAKGMDPTAPGNLGMSRALRLSRIGGDLNFYAFTGAVDAKGQRVRTPAAERRAKRAEARATFLAEHGLTLQDAGSRPTTVQFGNLFAGPGAQYAPGAAPASAQQGGYMGFAAPGTLPGAPPPAPPGAITWEQIAQLPPVVGGDNPPARLVAHFTRTELGGKTPDEATRTSLWRRASDVIGSLPEPPPAVRNYFTRA